MDKPIIEIENLGKRYRIGANKEKYLSLRDEMAKWLSLAARRKRVAKGEFWALKDVSFDVQQGETVGIIGRNGAGKSTLLKLLSKITPPTTGRIVRRGRVASLLEVGTGFHPELTGRENIYLNGAILGMSRREIARKFDEIVAFSEVERFLDTPVKRYSSGMYVRLAFAVAAHLEPEILVVDEVLSVGDAEFQKKCLGKMSDVATAGRTVLFVSHNMLAVSQLCSRGIILSGGNEVFDGPVDEALMEYTQGGLDHNGSVTLKSEPIIREEGQVGVIARISLTGSAGNVSDSFFVGEPMALDFDLVFFEPVEEFQMSFIIRSSLGGAIYHCVSRDEANTFFCGIGDRVRVRARFPETKLYPGRYMIDDVWLATKERKQIDHVVNCMTFHVPETSPYVLRPLGASNAIVHEVPQWTASYE